tara:strand:+ start:2201 stop:2842 length:642 start_codon:yes stop_codon:yes gene_type:complete
MEPKEIQKMLSIILHDTKRPFNNLKMFITLFKLKKDDPDFIEKNSDALIQEADGVLDLIRDLKEYFGHLKNESEEIKFGDLIEPPSTDFKKFLKVSPIKNAEKMIRVDLKLIKKGHNYLLSKLKDLSSSHLTKVTIEGTFSEGHPTINYKIFGKDIIKYINRDKFLRVFFSEGSSEGARDLKLALAHKYFKSSGCSINFIESEDFFELNVVLP